MTADAKHPAESNKPQTFEESLSDVDRLIETKRYYALKKLLFAEECARLDELEHAINYPKAHAKKIAPALPDAIRQSDLESVYQALDLNTLVQDKIIESVQLDSEMYISALYPVILPAIKKSITEAFKEMMQSLNYAIEQGFSLNRFSWHIEALRSGVPYREVVLRNTLTYRVEQVFLIHRESGLLMRHVLSKGVEQLRDSDAVSAMLTAIQDFIKDSFSVNEHDYLDTVEVGNYTVFLTRSIDSVLACVTQGIAPYSLRKTFDKALQTVNKTYSEELKNFEGDSSVLEAADEILGSCLVSEKKEVFEKKDPSIRNLVVLLLLIFIGSAYWRYDLWLFQKRAESYMTSLNQAVGVIITDYNYHGKHLTIRGMYDPLAKNPHQTIEKFGLQEQDISSSWQAYQSLEPVFLEQRIASLLLPPDTVLLKVTDNTLKLAGVADLEWIKTLALFKPAQLGVKAINTQALKTYRQAIIDAIQPPPTVTLTLEKSHLLLQGMASLDWTQSLPEKLSSLPFLKDYDITKVAISEEVQFQQMVTKLENFFIYFANGQATPQNAETEYIHQLTKMIKDLLKLSVRINKPIELEITGETDSRGSSRVNKTLAQKRAEYLMEQLSLQGITVNLKKAIRTATKNQKPRNLERKTSLKVIFNAEDV